MIDPVRERAAPVSPQMALRVAALGVGALVMFAIIFFRLWYLEVLSGDKYRAGGQQQQGPPRARAGAARGDRRPQQPHAGREPPGDGDPAAPDEPPDAERAAANRWGQAVGLRLRRPKGHRGPQIALPPVPYVAGQNLQGRFERLGKVVGVSVHDDPGAGDPAARDHAVRAGDDQDRRAAAGARLHQGAPGELPGRGRQARLPAQVPLPPARRPDRRQHRPGQPGGAQGRQVRPRPAGHDRRPGRPGVLLRPLPARPRRPDADRRRRATATRRGPTSSAPPQAGRQLQLSLDLGVQRAGAGRDGRAPATACPARSSRWTRRNGEVLALGSYPSFDPSILSRPITPAAYAALLRQGRRRAGLRPRDRRLLPDGFDVQADHGAGGADARDHHAGHADQRPGLPRRSASPTSSSATRARSPTAPCRCATRCRSPRTSSSTRWAATSTGCRTSRCRPGRTTSASGRRTGIDLPGEI